MFERIIKRLILTCIVAASAASAQAADFPTRDIRVIVPWAAGGGTDAIVRKISSIAEKSLPVSMYVQNIEGGMSATGLLQLIKARPNGYTLGALTYDSVITVPWTGTVPGYSLQKFKLIARITNEPDAAIVPADSPYKTIGGLIKAAKKHPEKIRAGIQNNGSRTNLTLLRLEHKAGVKFKTIAYPGGAAPQKEALLNGEVDFVITSLGDFAPLINSGKGRGLVEFSNKQNKAFPNVPPITQSDANFNLQMGSFIVLATPAGTPEKAVHSLENAYKKAFNSKAFQTWLQKTGVTPSWLGDKQVTQWADKTQKQLFTKMNMFAKEGLIQK